jgi:hypothetical protein
MKRKTWFNSLVFIAQSSFSQQKKISIQGFGLKPENSGAQKKIALQKAFEMASKKGPALYIDYY